jgi:hypothetical protein
MILERDDLTLNHVFPSLRAAGSYESKPNGKLRKAIRASQENWIASSQELLAMTG